MIVRRLGVVAAIVVLAAACSGGGDEATPEATATPVALEPTPTVEPVEDPTATALPEPTPVPSDPEAAEAAWRSFWEAVAVPDDDTDGLAAALAWGSQRAIDQVRSFPWGSTDRDVETFPVLEATGDAFAVNDCMFFSPGFGNEGGGVWWAGTVEQVDGAWTVTAADRVSNFDPCVPAELADAAIAGYEAYLDAVPVFWDPADPDGPACSRTITGHQLERHRWPSCSGGWTKGWVVQGTTDDVTPKLSGPSADRVGDPGLPRGRPRSRRLRPHHGRASR